jgi:SAM-dependent methyltransferase
MRPNDDTNAAIWKSAERTKSWVVESSKRERERRPHREFLAALLPFADDDEFTFLDLGAGTGAAAQVILARYRRCRAILADFSQSMIAEGERQLVSFGKRFRYVEFDLSVGDWSGLPAPVDAVVTSLCVHHLPDERKRTLFREVYEHLAPGGWYLNYDPVAALDPDVEEVWRRVNDRFDPEAVTKREHRSAEEQLRYENHIRYMIPLDTQLGYLRAAGFKSVDVYWKQLENVIYGGCRPK